MLALEDLSGWGESEVIAHLINSYSGDVSGFGYGDPNESDFKIAEDKLANMEVLIAYESVGSWGCDSTSFFLLRNKETGNLYEIYGGHCSCYGFEGQLDLEETDLKTLQYRINSGGGVFCHGGYDSNENENTKQVNEYILNM